MLGAKGRGGLCAGRSRELAGRPARSPTRQTVGPRSSSEANRASPIAQKRTRQRTRRSQPVCPEDLGVRGLPRRTGEGDGPRAAWRLRASVGHRSSSNLIERRGRRSGTKQERRALPAARTRPTRARRCPSQAHVECSPEETARGATKPTWNRSVAPLTPAGRSRDQPRKENRAFQPRAGFQPHVAQPWAADAASRGPQRRGPEGQ